MHLQLIKPFSKTDTKVNDHVTFIQKIVILVFVENMHVSQTHLVETYFVLSIMIIHYKDIMIVHCKDLSSGTTMGWKNLDFWPIQDRMCSVTDSVISPTSSVG